MESAVDAVVSSRYKAVSDDKADGVTYTPKALADFVAQQICRAASQPVRGKLVRVLDPATGDGELLISLLFQLQLLGIEHVEVHGFETDGKALSVARGRIAQKFPKAIQHLTHRNFLGFILENSQPLNAGGLFAAQIAGLDYDIIIANPPYVRTQVMGSEQAQLLASQFGLVGRVDLYHAFIVGMAHVLREGGIAGVIVSNRFMTTKSGGAVRQAIRDHFKVHHVWDLGDTKIFSAAVLPAVLLVEKDCGKRLESAAFTSVYGTTIAATQQTATVIDALQMDGVVAIADGRRFQVTNGSLDIKSASDAVWRLATAANDDWLLRVAEKTWRRFGEIGKIRVGVKTCADKVFIRTDWHDMPIDSQPELLRPLTTHHIARRFRSVASKNIKHILYPHTVENGHRRAVDLSVYPKSAKYLEQHRGTLEGRGYVIDSGRQWYEIWVPQDPSSWAAPKLVFRDIAEEPTFWIDLDGSIVNGDCYWLTPDSPGNNDILWLAAAVANSTFIETFYDHSFNNKLYAGRRRFITQYVENFPLPDPALPKSQRLIALAKDIYERTGAEDVSAAASEVNTLILESFGL